ncbi:MAG: hypothetical protein NT021_04320 [Sphingobacteriales bacterium]|nr:hypothetical protein [Sphingobacteriales bacterium]
MSYCADETCNCGSVNSYCGSATRYCADETCNCGSATRYCADATA